MSTLSSHTQHNAITVSFFITAAAVIALFIQLPAHAQQVTSPTAQAEVQAAPTKARIGDTTTNILQTQADGSMAGGALPILGPTATLSWQRYLESYKHPIPETFTRRLDEIGQR